MQILKMNDFVPLSALSLPQGITLCPLIQEHSPSITTHCHLKGSSISPGRSTLDSTCVFVLQTREGVSVFSFQHCCSV